MEWHIIYLDEAPSTNDVAREGDYVHGDVVVALQQTAGRGQRGNVWLSDAGENLTFSVVLKPVFLPLANQFLLSEVICLAAADALEEYGLTPSVKWPNDIYVDGNKIGGILIENDVKGSRMYRSVAGIGLNVNQTRFDPSLPNPTSMKIEKAGDYDLPEILSRFLAALDRRYSALEMGYVSGIEFDYHRRLYRVGKQHLYKLPDGTAFKGTIKHVRQSGELVIVDQDDNIREFLFKEVEFE